MHKHNYVILNEDSISNYIIDRVDDLSKLLPQFPGFCFFCLFSKMAELDRWVDIAKDCKYLPENDLKVSVFDRYGIYLNV